MAASQPVLSRDLRALKVAKLDGAYHVLENERVTPLAALKSLLRDRRRSCALRARALRARAAQRRRARARGRRSSPACSAPSPATTRCSSPLASPGRGASASRRQIRQLLLADDGPLARTMRVLLAYSGGLDTSWLVAWLTREQRRTRSPRSRRLRRLVGRRARGARGARARASAPSSTASSTRARELFERVLRWLIAGNVRRGGVYPLSVGAERGLQAEILARVGARARASTPSPTAAPPRATTRCASRRRSRRSRPSSQVLAPVRDLAPERATSSAPSSSGERLPMPPAAARYSVNAGLWGLTIGGGELHGSARRCPRTPGNGRAAAAGAHGTHRASTSRAAMPVALDGERARPGRADRAPEPRGRRARRRARLPPRRHGARHQGPHRLRGAGGRGAARARTASSRSSC